MRLNSSKQPQNPVHPNLASIDVELQGNQVLTQKYYRIIVDAGLCNLKNNFLPISTLSDALQIRRSCLGQTTEDHAHGPEV